MSSSSDSNYGLRPKRATKGKYCEMVGIPPTTVAEIENEDLNELANQNNCNVYLLPVVVSGSGENEVIATIEIDDPDNMILSDLNLLPVEEVKGEETEEAMVTTALSDQESSDPLIRIDELLKRNDQLIDSISEGPVFKKRTSKRIKPEIDDTASQHSWDDSKSEKSEGRKPRKITQAGTKMAPLSMSIIKEKICRCLTEEETKQIEEMLEKGKNKEIVEMFFGSRAENRVRKCASCSVIVEGSDSTYEDHFAEVHQSEATFSCELCDKNLVSASLYQNHIQSHFKGRTRGKKNLIDKNDSSEDGTETKDSSSEPFVCDICGKTLKHQKSLYSHRRTHTDSKAVCHVCGATLKSARYLHHHLLLHKDIDKPHKCDKCGKAFHSSSAMKVHHYYNHEEHPGRFQCTLCGKNFKAKQGLQFHMDSHSDELRYQCSFCQKRFKGFKTCRVHELRHREANEPNKFNCPICGKFFKTRQTLKNHEDVHASFNRYQCSICEKRFKLKKSCLAHIRVHHSKDNREENDPAMNTDEGLAVQSILPDGEEYVVTIEDSGEVDGVIELDGDNRQIEFLVPEVDVECEVEDFT